MEAYTALPDGLRGQTEQLTLCFHCFLYVNESETIDDQKGPQEIEEYQQKHTHRLVSHISMDSVWLSKDPTTATMHKSVSLIM